MWVWEEEPEQGNGFEGGGCHGCGCEGGVDTNDVGFSVPTHTFRGPAGECGEKERERNYTQKGKKITCSISRSSW